MSDVQLMLVIFANIDSAIAHKYGHGFQPAMATIRKLFKYDYVHTV